MPFLSSDRQCQNTAVNSKHCPQLMVQPLPFFHPPLDSSCCHLVSCPMPRCGFLRVHTCRMVLASCHQQGHVGTKTSVGLFDWSIDRLIDWLIDGLIDRLMIDGWSIDDRLFSGQIDWLIEMFVLQAVELMSSVPEWVDHLVELQLWVRLSQSALAAGDHASVSRCTDHALQFTCPDDQKQRSVASSTFLCWLQRNYLINY